jgi:hypothetical protein
METKQDTIEFKFVGEGIKTSFNSIDEALAYVNKKKLLPVNGESWEIEEIHHKIISHIFESERKVIDNPEITKRIIDYFLEHATIENVSFNQHPQFFNDPEHRNFRYHDQLYAYLCCKHYLGYTRDQFVELYKKFWNENCNEDKYVYFGDICKLCCYYAIKDKFGFDEKDICLVNDPKYISLKHVNHVLEANEKAKKEVEKWTHDMYFADGGGFTPGKYGFDKSPNIWRNVEGQELLDMYKEVLRTLPIENMHWSYNVGDYKPCHNFKLDVVKDPYNDKNTLVGDNSLDIIVDNGIHMWGKFIPGIMFRNDDVIVTNDKYYGRHVNLRASKAVDVDEKLYEYCIKNLK